LKPDNIGLIPTAGYIYNNEYIKKSIMWLLHMEPTDGVLLKHASNGREYRLPQMPHFGVDFYVHRRIQFMSFFGAIGRMPQSTVS